MNLATSTDVFFDQLKDVRSAAAQVAETLPDLLSQASDRTLGSLLEEHLDATLGHLLKIQAIFDDHAVSLGEATCKAMAGLIEGGNKHLQMAENFTIRDLLLIAHTSRIAAYLCAAAEFTEAIAKACDLLAEAGTIGEICAFESEFKQQLIATGADAFGLDWGVLR